jgi:WD40 repeat protein
VGAGPFVFLSYSHRDEEWRNGFGIVLKPLVQQRGSQLWVDKDGIRAGEVWRDELGAAIRASTLAVLLISRSFLESAFIMGEELTALEECGVRRLPVLVRECDWAAEPRLERLQWVHDPRVALGVKGRSVRKSKRDIVRICRRVAEQLEERSAVVVAAAAPAADVSGIAPAASPGVLSGVPPPPPGYIARGELKSLRRALLSAESGSVGVTGDSRTLGFYGQGGIGKTVLAVALARDRDVGLHFPDGIFWVTVGEAGDAVAAQLDLLARLGEPQRGARTSTEGRGQLQDVLRERRSLVVVDDVWSADSALALTATGPKGRTLYTTRDASVLEAIGAHVERVDALPAAAARELLATIAGTSVGKLPPDIDRVLAATDRVALALALVGAAAHSRSWAEIADDLERESATFLDHPYANTFKAMQVGVAALDDELARAYTTLAVFPGDTSIPDGAVARYWRHLWGAAPAHTRDTIEALAARGLITLQDGGFSFHDLQRDFVVLEAGRDAIVSSGELLAAFRDTLPSADAPWSQLPRDEVYLWHHLIHHLRAVRRHVEIAAVVTDLAYLTIRIADGGPYAAETDLRQAAALHPGHEGIAWLLRLVTQWSHTLGGDEAQIAATLAARAEGAPPDIDAAALVPLLPRRYLAARRSMPEAPRPLVRVFEHPEEEPGMALSPDGTMLAGARSLDVVVWDVASGEVVAELAATAAVKAAYSSDGGLLAVGGMLGVDVWAGSEHRANLRVPGGSFIEALAFSADSRRLAAGGTGTTCVWDVESGSVVATLDLRVRSGEGVPVQHLALSPDGQRVAVADEHGDIRLWEPDGRRPPLELPARQSHAALREVLAVAFTPDGAQLRTARKLAIESWDAVDGAPLSSFDRESAAIAGVFSADAEVVALAEGGLALRDVETGALVASLPTTGDVPDILAISRDRRLIASAGESSAIRVWDASAGSGGPGEPRRYWPRPLLAPDELTVALHSGDDLEIWDVSRERPLPVRRPSGLPPGADAFSGSLLAFNRGGRVDVWSLETGNRVARMRIRFGKVRTPLGKGWGPVAFGPGGLLAVAERRGVRIWEPHTGRTVALLDSGVSEPSTLAFSPDGRWIAVHGYDALTVGRAATGDRSWLADSPSFARPAFSRDSRCIASGTRNGGVQIREVATGATEATLERATERDAFAFSPDGAMLTTGRGDHVDVWVLDDASIVATLRLGVEINELVWGPWGITALTKEGLVGVELATG